MYQNVCKCYSYETCRNVVEISGIVGETSTCAMLPFFFNFFHVRKICLFVVSRPILERKERRQASRGRGVVQVSLINTITRERDQKLIYLLFTRREEDVASSFDYISRDAEESSPVNAVSIFISP